MFLLKFYNILSTLFLGFDENGLFYFDSEVVMVSIFIDRMLVYLLCYIGLIASWSSGSGQGVDKSDFTGFAMLAITFLRNSSLCCWGEIITIDSSVFEVFRAVSLFA